MSDLTNKERRKLEELFNMSQGYVLNFSNRSFADFFDDYEIDIYANKYQINGTSKANLLRSHWKLDANYIVGHIINGLINNINQWYCLKQKLILVGECREIADRLINFHPINEIGAFTATNDEVNFELLASNIRRTLKENKPEEGLDRLHTFAIKLLRKYCRQHGIELSQDKPLHSIFGEYIKFLRKGDFIESEMTDRILRSSISVFESFNYVRNNHSAAHDNPILNHEESLLIFNHMAATIVFIKTIELKIASGSAKKY